ncbi:MAG: PVC-type heme-binding CxxCH protein [Gemmataceae bacterium]
MLYLLLFAVAPPGPELPLRNSDPLSPAQERLTFQLPPGFRAELVAAEPHVIDPVALAFDERGRLFVAEMFGYPNGGRGTGVISSGRIKLLEDKDGDGHYETSRVYAEGLRFPTGVMPWRDGLLIANAPDLLYVEKEGAKPRVLYTGFDVANIQQLLNTFTLGLDGLVYATAGGAGGTIICPEKPDFKPVALRGRGIRFDPDVPGSLEPTSSGGQYGLTQDEAGRWFTATNSQHLRHVVLADEDLRRNPLLAVSATTLDIPEHGAACKVFRRSPFEAWRLERTTRRAGGADAKRFPPTELFPGGYATSACSPLFYSAAAFPDEYRGSVFVCDPANNVVMRDTLTPSGATFVARRGHADHEFLASTDNWFRPVFLTLGPDGAMYVADFYREVIETPLSLPEDILRRVNGQSRARGRVWRITAAKEGAKPAPASFDGDLTKRLDDANAWVRTTAQRLMLHRGQKPAPGATTAAGKVLTMWMRRDPAGGLTDAAAGVRENALRLTPGGGAALIDDPDGRVRYQAALSVGEAERDVAALTKLAARPDNDTWTQTAVLIAARGPAAVRLLKALPAGAALRPRLATLVGARGVEDEVAAVLAMLDETPASAALLNGLGVGLGQSGRTLASFGGKAGGLFAKASATAADRKRPAAERASAVRLLGYGPFDGLAALAPDLLSPRAAPEVQLAAVRALSGQAKPEVARLLLEGWPAAGPALRREMTEALFARPERVKALLDGIESKAVLPIQVEPARLAELRKTPRGAKLLAGAVVPARAKVVAEYASALKLGSDAARGKMVFAKHCAACHRLEGVGVQVGAELLAALRNKTAEALLIDILDPSREVDPRYLAYQVRTKRGTTLSGIVSADTAASMTLKRGEGAEDTVLRGQIEAVESTGKSLMPDGFEVQIGKQEMADLIRYLLGVK